MAATSGKGLVSSFNCAQFNSTPVKVQMNNALSQDTKRDKSHQSKNATLRRRKGADTPGDTKANDSSAT